MLSGRLKKQQTYVRKPLEAWEARPAPKDSMCALSTMAGTGLALDEAALSLGTFQLLGAPGS